MKQATENVKPIVINKLRRSLFLSTFYSIAMTGLLVLDSDTPNYIIFGTTLSSILFMVSWRYTTNSANYHITKHVYLATPLVMILLIGYTIEGVKYEGLLLTMPLINSTLYLTKRSSIINYTVALACASLGCFILDFTYTDIHNIGLAYRILSALILVSMFIFIAINVDYILKHPKLVLPKLLDKAYDNTVGNSQYYVLFSSSPMPTLYYNLKDNSILESNKAAKKFFNFSEDSVLDLKSIIKNSDLNRLLLKAQDSHDQMKSHKIQIEAIAYVDNQQTFCPMQCALMPLDTKDQTIFIQFKDISQEVKSNQKASTAQKEIRQYQNKSPWAIVNTKFDGTIEYASPIALKIHNTPKEDFIGAQILDYIDIPDLRGDTEKKLESLPKLIFNNGQYSSIVKSTQTEGDTHYYQLSLSFIDNPDSGIHSGLLWQYHDITDLYSTQLELIENGVIFEMLFSLSQQGIDVILMDDKDPDLSQGELIFRNETMGRILDDYINPFLGVEGYCQIQNPNYEPKEWEHSRYQKFIKELQKHHIYKEKLVILRPDTSHQVEAVHHFLMVNQKAYILRIFTDITDIVKKEAELLQKTDKLQAYIESNMNLTRFTAIASHDLQSPLRTINSFAQLLQSQERDNLSPKGLEFTQIIVNSTQKMQHLITDLLAFSKADTQALNLQKYNIAALIHEVIADIKHEHEGMDIHIQIDSELPTQVVCDPIKMNQVFANLLRNAIKFVPEATKPKITLKYYSSDTHHVFQIEDNGIGIETDSIDKIFDIFTRLHSTDKYKGSGIGLAICKKVVELHKGDIWVKSELGKGSTFHFTIAKSLRATEE